MTKPEPPPAAAERARILLVDDHPVVRQGLARLIEQEPDLCVCGEAETAGEALKAVADLGPALALVDLTLRDKPGLELIKDLRKQHPDVKVLVVSMHDESVWAERVLRAGACGYVMKQEKPRMLMARIRQALADGLCLSERMSERLLRKFTGTRGARLEPATEGLGDRELEVLQLMGQGLSPREIATALNVSIKTVDAHKENLKRKLDLGSAAELLRYAVIRFMSTGE
ncbi:MAG TPA: response regulator transcription factor [Planctomycetota bacterium]|jgi:DNA-binding NarL/FixJ family response regulator|nr:response regulator transcription factor [Planctomycetota bacterium]